MHQHSAEELLLKCNPGIDLIVTGDRNISRNIPLPVARNHDPTRFVAGISVIDGDDLSRKMLHRGVFSQKIYALAQTVTAIFPCDITVIHRICQIFMFRMGIPYGAVDVSLHDPADDMSVSVCRHGICLKIENILHIQTTFTALIHPLISETVSHFVRSTSLVVALCKSGSSVVSK